MSAERMDGSLEITLENESSITMYGYKVGDNGNWRCVRSNGQILTRQTSLNPKQMAKTLGQIYCDRGENGSITYKLKQ